MSEPSLPAHMIDREEAPTWLAGSAWGRITIHQTSASDARRIIEEGIRIERTARDAAWGQGFYTTTRPDPQYGDTGIRVAIRLMRPFVAEDPIDGQERVDALLAEAGSEDVRAVLLAAGFDGVIVHRRWRDEVWVIAYDDSQVRVVRDG
jgi:hypothetical protein